MKPIGRYVGTPGLERAPASGRARPVPPGRTRGKPMAHRLSTPPCAVGLALILCVLSPGAWAQEAVPAPPEPALEQSASVVRLQAPEAPRVAEASEGFVRVTPPTASLMPLQQR